MADIIRIDGGGRKPPLREPDAHGQAALMLVESLLHALVEAGTFTTADAIAIIGVAQDVKEEMGKASAESAENVAESIDILGQMATSFATDLQ